MDFLNKCPFGTEVAHVVHPADQNPVIAAPNPAEAVQNHQLKRNHVQEVVVVQKSLTLVVATQIAVQARDRTEIETTETEAEATHRRIREDQDHGKISNSSL